MGAGIGNVVVLLGRCILDAKLGVATDADFLSHYISPAGVRPNAGKVSALIKMIMPRDLKQVRTLMGGVGYYRKSLRDLPGRTRPITFLLRKEVQFDFTPTIEVIVSEVLAELATPPIWPCPTGTP